MHLRINMGFKTKKVCFNSILYEIPVSRHDEQKHRTGNLVDPRRDEIHFTEKVSKWPVAHHGGYHQERDPNQEAFIRNCQIHNVEIGDRLHFGESNHDVNHQSVPCQADEADNAVEDLHK